MATIHFRDDAESVTAERVFVTENGWVAISEEDEPPVLYPSDRVEKIEGREDIFYGRSRPSA
jgi:cupin superfamily acireductone dioxygenase involved in methionine salvage